MKVSVNHQMNRLRVYVNNYYDTKKLIFSIIHTMYQPKYYTIYVGADGQHKTRSSTK